MFNYLVAILVLAVVSAYAELSAQLSPTNKVDSPGVLGAIHPIVCTGAGYFRLARVSECNVLPCNLNNSSKIEIVFKPSSPSIAATLKVTTTITGGNTSTQTGPILPPILTPDTEFTLSVTEFRGAQISNEVTIQLEVLNDRKIAEICVSGLFNKGMQVSGATVLTASFSAVAALLLFGANQLNKY